jgi:8-oxo-dGTP diphosphatase
VQGTYTYEWPRPAVTVDAILVSKETPSKVLLIQRKQAPHAGSWALPGGFVDEMEPLHLAAARELQEETSVDPAEVGEFIQIGAYGNPGRDPRGWTIGVAFATLIDSSSALRIQAADDAAAVAWYDIENLPKLAFDHGEMLRDTFTRLSREDEAATVSGLKEQLERAAANLS